MQYIPPKITKNILKSARLQKAENEDISDEGENCKLRDDINLSSEEVSCDEEYPVASNDFDQSTKFKMSAEDRLALDFSDIRSLMDEKRTEIEAELTGD